MYGLQRAEEINWESILRDNFNCLLHLARPPPLAVSLSIPPPFPTHSEVVIPSRVSPFSALVLRCMSADEE